MAGYHLRTNQRFKEMVPLQYWREGPVGEGRLNDLSLSGASITGTVPVTVRMGLRVHLCVPGDPEPLLINRALVKWVKGLEFGVEFELLPAAVRAKLFRLISTLVHEPREARGVACSRGAFVQHSATELRSGL